MPLNSTSKTSPPPHELMERCCRRPWEAYVEPFPMAPGVWFIGGNDWVACYLIDTGDGLILIDTAMHETVYLMLQNIYKLGYKPTDIKKILITHAHIDHMGGARTMKELTGAEVYFGRRDLEYLHDRKDLIMIGDYTCGDIEPDRLYDDEAPISLGNITVQTISSPGHTPGCTSMFFDVTDKQGKILTCGIHGGVGLNTLSDEWLEQNRQPKSLRDEFIAGLKKLNKLHVDICLPSHTNQVGILKLVDQITEDFNPFVDESIWHELMVERIERAEALN
ncbi:MAG: MBL fold metallo-hydrolase [Candidatus Heteroscillospira sp.]|jgi:metallo-beta-lactamase class B